MFEKLFSVFLFFASVGFAVAQSGSIRGSVKDIDGNPLPYAAVKIANSDIGTISNPDGSFLISEVSEGIKMLEISILGYKSFSTSVEVVAGQSTDISAILEPTMLAIDEVVVTGTRGAKRQTDSPVIVNVIVSKKLELIAATNLSEGLCYQPGIRVETNCQTCNYTQLRMNGLGGGYSQILINGRPLFSQLMGLYGLEQIPANMIDRIETVRGGISSLYGSSAIGGTVNILTKVPTENHFRISNTYQSIAGKVGDNAISGNAALVNSSKTAGGSIFVNRRNRDFYDANGDNFSELPQIENNTLGLNLFLLPAKNQKLELSLNGIHEYRYGGEMVDGPAHLASQAEERTHKVFVGSLDYALNFKDGKSGLMAYYGAQRTGRDHYTGIMPDDGEAIDLFLANPPYGASVATTHQGGIRLNQNLKRFLIGEAMLTIGGEYLYEKVNDEIKAYNYLIDQTTGNFGTFIQHDWNLTEQINFLSGIRFDKHNLVENVVVSPRLSLMYKPVQNAQIRLGWGSGFRAPQAFDTDLHMAFAGGGISRISLDENLEVERSNSYTASFNFDKANVKSIYGFTIEGFYTKLDDVFYHFPVGEDEFGERFEKRNGSGATVKGVSLEARANFNYKVQFDFGVTLQSSRFDDPVENIEGLAPKREFMRTPDAYGYGTVTYSISKNTVLAANIVYTGPMIITHFGGENTGQLVDEYFTSDAFTDVGFRLGHTFNFKKYGLELFGGVKNAFDAYQTDFDIGKNRNSDYIYGPSLPRTYYMGLTLSAL